MVHLHDTYSNLNIFCDICSLSNAQYVACRPVGLQELQPPK